MRRCPHRVNFRLTQVQYDRYKLMIDNLAHVHGWTGLCLFALEQVANIYEGPWNLPLIPPSKHANGMEIIPDCEEVGVKLFAKQPKSSGRNGASGPGVRRGVPRRALPNLRKRHKLVAGKKKKK